MLICDLAKVGFFVGTTPQAGVLKDARSVMMMQQTGGWTPRTIRRAQAEAAVALTQRRRWFDNEPPPAEDDQQNDPPAQPEDVSQLPEWAQKIIRDTRADAAARRVEAKRLADEAAAREAQRLAEEGKWKELADARAKELDALKPMSERAAALEAKIQATNEARVKRIPESHRSLIPTGYTPEQLSEWLDANEGLLTRPAAPNLDGGAGSGAGGAGTQLPKLTEMEKQIARQMRLTDDQYAKRKAERDLARQQPKP